VQAKAQLANTRAALPLLETGQKVSVHRLGVLLGKGPAALGDELLKPAKIPMSEPNVPVGLPSELLRRRPDIRSAERQLAATTALVGSAVADYFPRFSLTGSYGRESTSTGNLFDKPSRFWSIGPAFSWPVFDAGRIRANVRIRTAVQKQALAQYEKTILSAIEDVENALTAYGNEQNRRDELLASVEANQRYLELSNELYVKGLTDFLNVIIAQRSLYTAQEELARSRGALANDLIALYKALGGGWE
jgi:NodT family efflux transporter outer membrane factor (OMF) lipoprotein